MTGHAEDPGILPRCFDIIFDSISHCQAKECVFRPDAKNGFDILSAAGPLKTSEKRDLPRLTPDST
ncbi:Kinesin-like protein KIF23 [Zootermopsis nevadensis]|uniref:Kinesin-like protein KIF23 n=1 Tax=Zootermopsis nevadensis TaxID=136037 RepID=A0A067QSK5_ZOONE|nr:Kinesin-like protein KIF23 [Zootermopsis nevadensis]